MSLIAVRRNITPGAVFFRLGGIGVQYSLDNNLWYDGWIIPPPSTSSGGSAGGSNIYDFSKGPVYYQELYGGNYYQTTNFDVVINNFALPGDRTQAVNQIDGLSQSAYSDISLCSALTAQFQLAREAGKGIANGSIEQDDFYGMWNAFTGFWSGLVGVGVGFVTLNPWAGAAAAGGMAAVMTGLTQTQWDSMESYSSWSDVQMADYTCCVYEALKGGAFTYDDYVQAGVTCGIGAWDEIATPEWYSMLITLVKDVKIGDMCECETCLALTPVANGQILKGQVVEGALLNVEFVTGGTVREMWGQVKFTFPSMVITSCKTLTLAKSYENVAVNNPMVTFSAPNTGGGNTQVAEGLAWTALNPAHFPLLAVTECTLTFRVSVCSACSTAQLSAFAQSYGSLIQVILCGI